MKNENLMENSLNIYLLLCLYNYNVTFISFHPVYTTRDTFNADQWWALTNHGNEHLGSI